MRQSTNLPDLRILPTKKLNIHEDSDPRRVERLSQRLREDGILKNPLITAPIPGTDKFVVLDGANRALAFISMGIPHIVTQLVSYEDSGVELDTWYHVVAGMELDIFEKELTKVTGLQLRICSLGEARQALENHIAAAYIVCTQGVRMVCNSSSSHRHDTRLLNDLVSVYKGKSNIFRASNDIWEKQAPYYPDITALVVFPRLSPGDIIQAAQSDEKIPTGITRHIIPNRALNINIPLKIMEADWPQERKDAWMKEWLMDRMAADAIRFYSESTFSFNE